MTAVFFAAWLLQFDLVGHAVAAQQAPGGQQLVQAAARLVQQQPPLEADIWQQIDVFGEEVIGSGNYRQFGRGTKMIRLYLSFAVEGKPFSSLLQISDGERFLYTRQDGPKEKTLRFVNLERVEQAIAESETPPDPSVSANLSAHGGLPKLLIQLDENFDFGEPRLQSLGDPKIPVWIMRGKWKREKLAKLIPGQKDAILAGRPPIMLPLGPQVPHEVELTLGRDMPFRGFPYQIVFLREETHRNRLGSAVSRDMQPFMTLKFFKVRHRTDLTAEHFQYDPDDEDDDFELIDETAGYLKRIGL